MRTNSEPKWHLKIKAEKWFEVAIKDMKLDNYKEVMYYQKMNNSDKSQLWQK